MLVTALSPDTLSRGVLQQGPPRTKSDYFTPENPPGLQAYLLEHAPENIVHPHFHVVDQFQLFLAGSGRVGKHRVGPFTIHYTDKYSPYGPIVAGSEGLTFATLRIDKDIGAQYMPESRAAMTRRAGRNLTRHYTVSVSRTLRLGKACEVEVLEPRHSDGLLIEGRRTGPSGTLVLPDVRGSEGHYLFIIHGSLILEDGEAPLWSCLFQAQGASAVSVHAGRSGCDLLVLQFPHPENCIAGG